ncbi:hypothetical protein SLS58_004063 [Diplodia intermedia]|uniref:F-box domain-containing protein n=1 Tax=Diplodia intermedia TaxID=856260 RepID=A0ABR3TVC3_9PEZI
MTVPMVRNAAEYPAPWTDAELEPYKAYPELYNERKQANYTTPRSRLNLSAFPAEIRLQILTYLLTLPHAIDFTTTYLTPSRYTALLRPRLALLRLNRTIGAEARATFYARNEFRFTTRSLSLGAAPPRAQWLLLASFMATIGARGCQHLRHVAVDAPLRFDAAAERAWDPLVLAALRADVAAKAPALLPALDARLVRAVELGEREERLVRRADEGFRPDHVARERVVREVVRRFAAAGGLRRLDFVVGVDWDRYPQVGYFDGDGGDGDGAAVVCYGACTRAERDEQAHCRNHRDVFVWEWLDRLCAAMRRRLKVAVVLQHGDYVGGGLGYVLKHVPVLLEAKRRGYAVGHARDDDGEAGGEYAVTFDDYVMEDVCPTWSLADAC